MLKERSILIDHFEHIEKIAKDISIYVKDDNHTAFFRSELAGMLNVTIAACYEACIKDILIEYSTLKNIDFGDYIEKQYEKLNSRIQILDLNKLAKLFSLEAKFKEKLSKEIGINTTLQKDYENILKWRHEYAHAYKNLTTMQELLTAHGRAKNIIYAFHDTFLN